MQEANLLKLLFISLLLDGWGFLGIWLENFGFKNVWEVWVYQVCILERFELC
jgi:Vacuole effluxer Atg22 like